MSDQHNLRERLYSSLYNIQRQVNHYYSSKVFKKYNLTYPQFLALAILWDESPVNIKKIVTELVLDIGTVSPLLRRMEQVNLIKRERSEVDQREVFVHLVDKSETIRPKLSNASDKTASVSLLSQDEVKELNHLLGKVIHTSDETREK